MKLERLRRAVSFFALCHVAVAQRQCYFPNGRQAENNFPCDPDASDSPCCGGGFGTACLSNKLCRGPDGNIIRGSCTDRNWQSSDCPLFCLSANTGGTDLISCSNVTGTDTSYCCDHQAFCCDSGVARFDVLPSKPEVLANWDPSSSAFVPVQRTTSSSSSSATSSSISTTLTTTTTQSATSSPPADLSAQSQPPQSGLSVGAQAGIGVGVAIAVVAAAVVAFLLFKLHKKNRALQAERDKATQNGQWSGTAQELPVGAGYYYGGREYKADGGGSYPSPQQYGVPQQQQPAELGAVSQTHELDGSSAAGRDQGRSQGPG